jgi:drug/metabolite transporter (DMT)-like permease
VATATKRRFSLRAALALAATLLALGSWALSSPVGSSPDDDFHLASIWCGQGIRAGNCEAGTTPSTREVPTEIATSLCFAYQPETSASCQPVEHRSPTPLSETNRGNFDGLYPPLFYAGMSLFVGPSMGTSVLLMRLANSVLALGVLAALLALAPARRRASVVWGYGLTVVPLGLFIIPSTNPSSWAVIGVGGFWIAALCAWENSGSRRWLSATLALLLAVIAAGSRGDAAIYVALSAVVVAVVTWPERHRRDYRWWIASLAAMAILAGTVFLLTGQAAVATQGLTSSTPSTETSALSLALVDTVQLPTLWIGIFGSWGLGWLDTSLPSLVWAAGLCAFVGICFLAVTRAQRSTRVAAALVAVALWLVPLYVLVKSHAYVGAEVQPRYALPLFTLFAGLLLWNWSEGGHRLSRIQTWSVVLALGVANALALNVNIARYTRGLDVRNPWLDSGVEWWWANAPSPMTVWVVGAASFALALTLAAPLLAGGPASRRAEHPPIPAE